MDAVFANFDEYLKAFGLTIPYALRISTTKVIE